MDSCFKLKKSMEGIVLHAWRLRPTKGDSFALPRAFAAAKWVMNAKVQLYAAGNGPHALASRTMLNVVEVFWYDAWAQACQALKRGDYVALSGDGIVALARTAREMPVFVLSGPPAGLQVASAIRFRLWPAAAKAKGDGTTQRVHAALALDLTHASVSDSARAPPKKKANRRNSSAGYMYTELAALQRGEANVVGVVAGFTLPHETMNDLMMTLSLTGPSIHPRALSVNVFARDEASLPDFLAVGDVVRAHRLTIQTHKGVLQGVGNSKRTSWVVWHGDGARKATSSTFTCTIEDRQRVHALQSWSHGVDWVETLASQVSVLYVPLHFTRILLTV